MNRSTLGLAAMMVIFVFTVGHDVFGQGRANSGVTQQKSRRIAPPPDISCRITAWKDFAGSQYVGPPGAQVLLGGAKPAMWIRFSIENRGRVNVGNVRASIRVLHNGRVAKETSFRFPLVQTGTALELPPTKVGAGALHQQDSGIDSGRDFRATQRTEYPK